MGRTGVLRDMSMSWHIHTLLVCKMPRSLQAETITVPELKTVRHDNLDPASHMHDVDPACQSCCICVHAGTITVSELKLALRGLGQNPTEADLRSMMDHVDANKTGTIEFSE